MAEGALNPHARTLRGALPLFITRKNKIAVGWFVAFMAPLLYISSNWIHFFVPTQLPMTRWDLAIPIVPQWVFIYISEYLFFVAVYVTSKDMTNLNKWFYSFMSLQTVSVLIFFLWPTTYPRDLFPIPPDTDGFTRMVFEGLRSIDSPANCCPSLHVSSVFLSSFIYLDEQRGKFPLFFGWGMAIAVSTLPTKQHYLIDVVTGLAMAILFYFLFHRVVRYRALGGAVQANR
jgi:membrane-associated phospholipid phosphatase